MPRLDAPPATDKASFSTNLSESDAVSNFFFPIVNLLFSLQFLSWRLAETFNCSENVEHGVAVVHLKWVSLTPPPHYPFIIERERERVTVFMLIQELHPPRKRPWRDGQPGLIPLTSPNHIGPFFTDTWVLKGTLRIGPYSNEDGSRYRAIHRLSGMQNLQ